MKKQKKVDGFTLIELLVVIAIIGMLASMVSVSVQFVRMKARDARRINDLTQIRTALEMYYTDHGSYPPTPCGYDVNCYNVSTNATWDTLANHLRPYIGALPRDPLNPSTYCGGPWDVSASGAPCYTYSYGNVGNSTYKPQYDLTAKLEDPLNPHRAAIRNYRYYFNGLYPWTGYSGQMYEASLE